MGLRLWIGLGIYAVYFISVTIYFKNMMKSLKYLHTTPPNFMHKCKAACRYDFVHLRPWEMYLCAWTILPIRLVMALLLIMLQTIIVLFLKLMFCGRYF
jgi:hypothetical protein